MSYEMSFAGVLALGESDEEDPVFEIGFKLKKKHSKAKSDEYKVSPYPNIFAPRLTHICFDQTFIK